MPRFQLLVREPGKEPRVVPLNDPIVVGRSRSVDLTVDDEEVGRKQFRIGVNQGFVVLEGLGATNPTRVEQRAIKTGESTTIDIGETIAVGKSEFVLQSADATAKNDAPPEPMDATMVAGPGVAGPGVAGPGGIGGGPGAAAPPPSNEPVGSGTGDPVDPGLTMPPPKRPGAPGAGGPPATPPGQPASPPMNTMEFRPPGVGGPGAVPPNPVGGETAANAKRPMPGGPVSPPGGGKAPETGGFELGQTMAKGFRPGAPPPGGTPPPPAQPPATPPASPPPVTPPPVTPPRATPPQPATPPPAQPKATPPPAQPKAPLPPLDPPAAPNVPATPGGASKPKTVAVRPEEMAGVAGAAPGNDIESRLHQSTPRMFVKGEGLKRPVRLMKPANKVGRAETADVLLPHESVSENHAEVCFDGTHWSLVDQGSTNGTIVDGEHLRSTAKELRRNSLIGIGALKLIFLCTNAETAAQDSRDEDRALRVLTGSGHLDKSTANEIRQMVRSEASQSVAEIVLRDTPISPVDWANAIATARKKVSLLTRILRLFGLGK